jgi:hypothetical protein
MNHPPTNEDFVRQAAPLRVGCDQGPRPLVIQSVKTVESLQRTQFAVALGLISHGSHDHLILIQLVKASNGDWQLDSDAVAETRHAPSDAFVVLDMRSSGTFSIGARLTPPARMLRLTIDGLPQEAEIVGGVALLTVRAGTSTSIAAEVLDAGGQVLRVHPLSAGLMSDLGISYRR